MEGDRVVHRRERDPSPEEGEEVLGRHARGLGGGAMVIRVQPRVVVIAVQPSGGEPGAGEHWRCVREGERRRAKVVSEGERRW